jgi:hypothetical protein
VPGQEVKVLYCDLQRFALVMTRREIQEDGEVVADLFLKQEAAENASETDSEILF